MQVECNDEAQNPCCLFWFHFWSFPGESHTQPSAGPSPPGLVLTVGGEGRPITVETWRVEPHGNREELA